MHFPTMKLAVKALCTALIFAFMTGGQALGQNWINTDDDTKTNRSTFRDLDDWPAPNDYRNAAGAPGRNYWQQKADYKINTTLDTVEHKVKGSERITYYNNSPDNLPYLWLQLDQNVRSREHSRTYATSGALNNQLSEGARAYIASEKYQFDGGYDITRVQVVGDNWWMRGISSTAR